ncbi:N-acetyltransferase family protein [Gilvimarinus sp. F26214L]|uniref:GNAT family N-acetyltransferase n=1 Tax=Gilvimarinus sp. DZF01 TaxID=3461371 RepID=UPI0040453E2C
MSVVVRLLDVDQDIHQVEKISRIVQLKRSHIREFWEDLSGQGAIVRVSVAQHSSKGIVGFRQMTRQPNAEDCFIQVVIDSAGSVRNRGVGGKLYDEMLAFALDKGVRRLSSWVWADDVESLSFAQRRGFEAGRRVVAHAMTAMGPSDDKIDEVISSMRESGIGFRTMAELPNDERAQKRIYDLHQELLKDSPGAGDWFPPFSVYQQQMFHSPSAKPEGIIVATDGDRWVGLTIVLHYPYSNRTFGPILGVIREYRGRNIGRILQHFSRQYRKSLRTTYHTYTYDAENAPMKAMAGVGTRYIEREFFPLSKEISI